MWHVTINMISVKINHEISFEKENKADVLQFRTSKIVLRYYQNRWLKSDFRNMPFKK